MAAHSSKRRGQSGEGIHDRLFKQPLKAKLLAEQKELEEAIAQQRREEKSKKILERERLLQL